MLGALFCGQACLNLTINKIVEGRGFAATQASIQPNLPNLILRGHASAPIACPFCAGWRYNMSSINCTRETRRTHFGLFLVSPPRQQNVVRLLAFLLTSATLAACAQSPAATNKSELLSTGRHASLATDKHAAGITSYGLASYYSEGTQTASGEQYDPNALTAAHPNLPFGTKLRVTNVATGRSVIVRVNDRGPFVPGRVVDVSSSAAAALGMVGRGTAQVKLDVIQ